MFGNWKRLWLAGVTTTALVIGCGPSLEPEKETATPVKPPVKTDEPPAPPIQEKAEDKPLPVEVPAADLKALVDGNNAFAIDLYKKLAEKETGNLFISPYSISSALAMTYAGARGQTAEEMANVLGLSQLGDRAHPAHAALAHKLRSEGGKNAPAFHIANALWGQRGLPLKDEFLRLTKDNYAAGVRQVDFAGDTDGSRRTINSWVGEKTRGKIPELLKPSDLSPASRLVLTNAIYFKGNWTSRFPSAATRDGVFHRDTGERVTLPFMTQTARLRYANTGVAEVLELPYEGTTLSMVVILPPHRATAELTGTAIDSWLRDAVECEVTVSMPRFRVRAVAELSEPLKGLGMPTAFSLAADFSEITPSGGLQVSRVVHEACIEVDETGTEAAAATAVDVGVSAPRRVKLRLDRSFIVSIRDRNSGAILFLGRVADPQATVGK